MLITISSQLNSEFAIFHSEGILIYNLVEAEIKKNKPVTLSFKGLDKCSTQFLNAVVGKLYLTFPKSKLKKLLLLENEQTLPLLKEKINDVVENALRPASNNTSSLDNALSFN